MRIVCISDTHNFHRDVRLPAGDVLVHAGDFTGQGTFGEARHFLEWLETQTQFGHRVLVAGNHDWLPEQEPRVFRALVPRNVTYLEDAGAELDGVRFWGSPITPWFHSWAFNRARGAEIDAHWARIPQGVDVLVTHGPPYLQGDRVEHSDGHVGCEDLRRRVDALRPRLHVFGHIHEGYGDVQGEHTRFVNASVCDRFYRPVNAPIVVDL